MWCNAVRIVYIVCIDIYISICGWHTPKEKKQLTLHFPGVMKIRLLLSDMLSSQEPPRFEVDAEPCLCWLACDVARGICPAKAGEPWWWPKRSQNQQFISPVDQPFRGNCQLLTHLSWHAKMHAEKKMISSPFCTCCVPQIHENQNKSSSGERVYH